MGFEDLDFAPGGNVDYDGYDFSPQDYGSPSYEDVGYDFGMQDSSSTLDASELGYDPQQLDWRVPEARSEIFNKWSTKVLDWASNNPGKLLQLGVSGILGMAGLFMKNGKVVDAQGREVQLSPQEKQFMDLVYQQALEQANIASPSNKALGDAATRNAGNLGNLVDLGLSNLVKQQQGQNTNTGIINAKLYGGELDPALGGTPLAKAFDQDYGLASRANQGLMSLLDQEAEGSQDDALTIDMDSAARGGLDYAANQVRNADAEIQANYLERKNDPILAKYKEDILSRIGQKDPVSAAYTQQVLDRLANGDPIERGFAQRVMAALSGRGELDPAMLREQAEARQALEDRLRREGGSGATTSTWGLRALSDLNTDQEANRFKARQDILTRDEAARANAANTFANITNSYNTAGLNRDQTNSNILNAATDRYYAGRVANSNMTANEVNSRNALANTNYGIINNLAEGANRRRLVGQNVMDSRFNRFNSIQPKGLSALSPYINLANMGSFSGVGSLGLITGQNPANAAMAGFNGLGTLGNNQANTNNQNQLFNAALQNQNRNTLLNSAGYLFSTGLQPTRSTN